MKTQSILIYIALIVITIDAETKLKPAPVTKKSSPEERRKLSLFPKGIKKYVFTEKPVEKAQLSNSRGTGMTKRTVMPRISIKYNNIEDSTRFVYREPISRRPLMKFKKFTIDLPVMEPEPETLFDGSKSSESFENDYEKDAIAHDYVSTGQSYTKSKENDAGNSIKYEKYHAENTTVTENAFVTDSAIKSENTIETEISIESEENDTENAMKSNVGISNEHIEEYVFTTESELSELTETENHNLDSNRMQTEGITVRDSTNFISEKKDQILEDDLNEFIFIEKISSKSKNRRSVNVIEEENLGTTISGFKFTGREFRLTNDLAYKNINA